uniref:ADAM metallopeptidase domain 9a n=1 Tax=Amphilophus citrinellus TaxID=61819 RepID=A0A3Q0R882_AMPCI
ITVDGNDHFMLTHLQILPDFSVFQDHCHYRGFIQDMEGSSVAMSICNGLRGVMHLSADSYGIEPLDSAPDQHLLYRLQDVTSQPRGCETPHDEHGHNSTEHARSSSEEIPHGQHRRVFLSQTACNHIFFFLQYIFMNRNATAVREEMVLLANLVDSIYMQLNIRVVLVGLEIWTQQNLINVDGAAGEVLSLFTQWREKELVPRRRHDSAQLILSQAQNCSIEVKIFQFEMILENKCFLSNCYTRCTTKLSLCVCECEEDPCCEYQTCKLKSGAQCAYGECCSNCQFLPGGTVCRSTTDECDLPEYCNGTSSFCQSDVFIQNGQACRNQEAYCYNGKCQHYDSQCRAIFGAKAKAAPELCFKDVNSKGDRFGNCGYLNNGYKKCESRNAMCGKLQCSNVQAKTVFGIEPSIITTPIAGGKCYGVDFMLGSDVPDPGMVNEGTKCGENKVCMNFECRTADVLKYDCDVQTKCHGHGVCNSNKNCHCEYGWAPPFCELKGYGGSLDSGPTWNGTKNQSTGKAGSQGVYVDVTGE